MRRFSALALVLLLASATANAQPPPELHIPDLVERETSLIIGRVFPVGWSPDGLFAYVYEPADEACGCYFFELIVQDLKSDRIAWRYEYNSGKDQDGAREPFLELKEIWKAKEKQFAAKLHELGIVRRDDVKLELFAESTAPLRVKLAIEEKGDNKVYLRHISRFTVELSGPQGRKTIFRSETAGIGDDQFGPEGIKSQGYLRSPYEARIAVLLEETWRGWEGFPYVARIRFIGADLERGFH